MALQSLIMDENFDRHEAEAAAHLASVVAFLRTYADCAVIDLTPLPDDPTLSQLQRAARECGLQLHANIQAFEVGE